MIATQHIYSIRKIVLLLIILTAISPAISALELTMDAPSEVAVNEEFSVTISADSSETYDVKIFIHTSEDQKIDQNEYISEIYDEASQTWKNPYYYIKEAFPQKTEFQLRAISSPGEHQICLRLRKTSDKDAGFEQICNQITLTDAIPKSQTPANKKENSKSDESDDEENLPQIKVDRAQQTVQNSTELLSEKIITPEPKTRIILSTKSEVAQTQKSESIKTSEGKTKDYLLYGFMFLSLILAVFIALRKL